MYGNKTKVPRERFSQNPDASAYVERTQGVTRSSPFSIKGWIAQKMAQ